MPHVEGLSLSSVWSEGGQSRFAGPVAAATSVARRAFRGLTAVLAQRSPQAPKEREARELEAHYARASDRHALERMERDWDRRDGGGLRNWDGR